MITTVIGSYPKPHYLKITDWFNATGGTDTENSTKYYEEEIETPSPDFLSMRNFPESWSGNIIYGKMIWP